MAGPLIHAAHCRELALTLPQIRALRLTLRLLAQLRPLRLLDLLRLTHRLCRRSGALRLLRRRPGTLYQLRLHRGGLAALLGEVLHAGHGNRRQREDDHHCGDYGFEHSHGNLPRYRSLPSLVETQREGISYTGIPARLKDCSSSREHRASGKSY
jgi:hypothetical protein